MKKMKKIKAFFVAIIAICTVITFLQKQANPKISDLLVDNIEALANDEHHIDTTLTVGYALGRKTIYFIFDGKLVSTEVYCCMANNNTYSGCALNGLGDC